MKKRLLLSLSLFLTLTLIFGIGFSAAADSHQKDLSGRYIGYSWSGESKGVEFAEAEKFIETILELDENGEILDVKMLYFVQKDGFWTTRQSGNAHVEVDFNVEPTEAVPGENYQPGKSMFTIYTADMMSFYVSAVAEDGTAAFAIVDPVTRYQYEIKLPADFDYQTEVKELKIGSELVVPTTRTSSSGLEKPESWEEYADETIFGVSFYSHVMRDQGVFSDIKMSSTVEDLLAAAGVEFVDSKPQAKPADYGYFGLGGWAGNYAAIEDYLIGKNAQEVSSLVDWEKSGYKKGINEDNFFGVDTSSGATKTVQNSYDGIAGATVRMSRESTSYQRALAAAGILTEEEVVKGRF